MSAITRATLPSELISCIVANVDSQPTLCNLAQCSRQLYFCTIPHLYRHVTVNGSVSKKEQQREQLPKLASLLCRRPDLAGLVRCFTLHAVSESSEDLEFEECDSKIVNINIDQALKTAVDSLGLSTAEVNYWLRQLSHPFKCSRGLIFALLLPALLNVKKLVLDLEPGFDTFYVRQIIERVARREKPFDLQPAFGALTVFEYSHEESDIRNTAFIASLLKLPAIRLISGAVGRNDYFGADKNLIELDDASSPLTCLNLSAYALSMAELGHILRAPKALNTFFYTVCLPVGLNFTEIRHALGPQENCLERLGFDYDEEDVEMYDQFFSHMTSFISFNTLKVFKIAAIFLQMTENGTEDQRLINIFPPNLETLHLTGFQSSFFALYVAIEYLLEEKSSQQIPSLKTIILEETKGSKDQLTDELWENTQETVTGRLSRVAAAQGVSLVVIPQ